MAARRGRAEAMTHCHPRRLRRPGHRPLRIRHLMRRTHRLFRTHQNLGRSERYRMWPSFPRYKRRRLSALAFRLASAPIRRSDQARTLVGSMMSQLGLRLATSPQAGSQSARVSSSAPLAFVAAYSLPMQPRRVCSDYPRFAYRGVITRQMIQIKDSNLFVVIDSRHGLETNRHRAI
jgi:hypothetical protein